MKILKTPNLLIAYVLMLIFCMSCRAQTILPLNTPFMSIPNGAYIKDTNNELNQFIGVYKANHNGNEITLYITKENDKQIKSGIQTFFFSDVLVVKFIVKNSSGQILQDTQNFTSLNNGFYSIGIEFNKVSFTYQGANCRVGQGLVYLKKLNATELTWDYLPQEGYSKNCPPGTNATVYLPLALGLIFTKQ